jgi:hypothetical protein
LEAASAQLSELFIVGHASKGHVNRAFDDTAQRQQLRSAHLPQVNLNFASFRKRLWKAATSERVQHRGKEEKQQACSSFSYS